MSRLKTKEAFMPAMNIVKTFVTEIEKAFGYETPAPRPIFVKELPSFGLENPIAPHFLEHIPEAPLEDGRYLCEGIGYVHRGEEKPPVRVIGDRMYIPSVEIFASSSMRCVRWMMDEDHKDTLVEGLLKSLTNELSYKLDVLVLRLVREAITSENNWAVCVDDFWPILTKLDSDAYQLLVSPAHLNLIIGLNECGKKFNKFNQLPADIAFVVPLREKVGITTSGLTTANVSAWYNAQEGTFGLSAIVANGFAIARPNAFSGIKIEGKPYFPSKVPTT
jgi:hypothetical protein